MNLLPVQCATPGCPGKAVDGGRCPTHRVYRWPASGGYGWAWTKVRNAFIAQHPICEWPGCTAASAEVDHIVRVKVDPSRRLDPPNLRALCARHHRSRTGADALDGRRRKRARR